MSETPNQAFEQARNSAYNMAKRAYEIFDEKDKEIATLKAELDTAKAKLEALQYAMEKEIKGERNLFPNLAKALRTSRATREGLR